MIVCAALAAAAAAAGPARTVTDDLGHVVRVTPAPLRIAEVDESGAEERAGDEEADLELEGTPEARRRLRR